MERKGSTKLVHEEWRYCHCSMERELLYLVVFVRREWFLWFYEEKGRKEKNAVEVEDKDGNVRIRMEMKV